MKKEIYKKLNFKEETPIQSEMNKYFKNNKNLVLVSPTGTGKTHAYLVPIYLDLDPKKDEVQALIIVPTNELVIQVFNMLNEFNKLFKIKAYYGSLDKEKELKYLKNNNPQIVISTPYQLKNYVIKERALQIYQAKYLVFDEADMMFDDKFLSEIDVILDHIKNTKLILISATINNHMKPFISKYFGNYDLVDTTKKHDLKINYYNLLSDDRLYSLNNLVKNLNPFLSFIFVSKKEDIKKVYHSLLNQKIDVVMLDSSLGVRDRKKIIDDIKLNKYQYVVTSDLLARGLDFEITHIINYDLPYHLEYFIHRSGRTGRMNKDGEVYTIYFETESRKIDRLRQRGIEFKNIQVNQEGIKIKERKVSPLMKEELKAAKKVKKPSKVKPNYKKKYQKEVEDAKKKARRKKLYG